MSLSAVSAIGKSIDRLRTTTGVVLFGLFFVVQFFTTFASQNQAPAGGTPTSTPTGGSAGELGSLLQSSAAAQQVLDVGLSPGIAFALTLVFGLGGLLVQIVGIRAIAEQRDSIDAGVLDGLAWRAVNVIGGTILLGVAGAILAIPIVLLSIIPILGWILAPLLILGGFLAAAIGLFYYTPTIAVDGENAIEAIGTSINIAQDNLLSTVGLVAALFVIGIGELVVSITVLSAVPPAAFLLLSLPLGAATSVINVSIFGTAYDLARSGESKSPVDEQDWSNDRSSRRGTESTTSASDAQWGTDSDSQSDDDGWGTDR